MRMRAARPADLPEVLALLAAAGLPAAGVAEHFAGLLRIGGALVDALFERVRAEGLAEAWFARRGFEPRPRSEAPPALGASEEFRGACPASAACLRLRL